MYVRSFGTGNTWIPGESSSGPVSFVVKCSDGKLIRRHQDHLRPRKDDQPLVSAQPNQESDDIWIDVGSNDENAETETPIVDHNREENHRVIRQLLNQC